VEAVYATMKDKEDDPDWVVLQADLRNAFNSVHRAAFIKAVEEHLPVLSPWVRWTYDTRAELLVNSPEGPITVLSEEGCQQGDPLGPLLFCLAIHAVILSISEEVPGLDLNAWYFDDGTLGGPTKEVAQALELFVPRAAAIGLQFNFSKSVLHWPARTGKANASPTPSGSGMAHPTGGREEGDITTLSPTHDPFNSSLVRSLEGIVTLGAPMGSEAFMAKKLGERLKKAEEALRRLPLLDDPQVAFQLLRSCAGFCRVVYLSRALSCTTMESTAEAFDRGTISTLEAILGVPLGVEATLQVQQPIVEGGLGLRSSLAHLGAARLASVNANRATTQRVLEATQDSPPPHSSREEPAAQLAISLRTEVDQIHEDILESKTQREISKYVDSHESKRLMDLLDLKGQARYTACKGPFGALILTASPSRALGTRLSPSEFGFFICHRLGLPNFFEEEQPCALCSSPHDKEGFHALTCRHGGSLQARHNAIRNIIYQGCRKAAWNPALEVALVGGQRALVPADVYVPQDIAGPQALALDITVTHPLQIATVTAASKEEGAAARMAEEKKRGKHGKSCEEAGLTFVPMAFEVFGKMGEEATKMINNIGVAIGRRMGIPQAAAVRDLNRRIAFALTRTQAEAVRIRADPDWLIPSGGGLTGHRHPLL